MKITAISDTHGIPILIKSSGDVLIHCGDATNLGTVGEFKDFVEEFSQFNYKHKIFVAGNHDLGLQNEKKSEILQLFQKNNIIYLEDSEIIINDIKFYGSPWTTKYGNWAFMKEDDELEEIWDKIPSNTDILITHGPPFGILDINRSGLNCGSKTLFESNQYLKPTYHIFGHIHEQKGIITAKGQPVFINASQLDEMHRYTGTPITFHI